MVKEINNFLSDEDCDKLINLSSDSFDNVEVLGENIDGYRVAKGTWLEEEHGEVVIKYRKLISEITQIPTINMESINVLKYLIDEKNKIFTSSNVKSASLSGELDVLKYFFDEKGFMLEPKDFPFTINNAETQIVKDYLIQKQKEQNK